MRTVLASKHCPREASGTTYQRVYSGCPRPGRTEHREQHTRARALQAPSIQHARFISECSSGHTRHIKLNGCMRLAQLNAALHVLLRAPGGRACSIPPAQYRPDVARRERGGSLTVHPQILKSGRSDAHRNAALDALICIGNQQVFCQERVPRCKPYSVPQAAPGKKRQKRRRTSKRHTIKQVGFQEQFQRSSSAFSQPGCLKESATRSSIVS